MSIKKDQCLTLSQDKYHQPGRGALLGVGSAVGKAVKTAQGDED